MASPPLPFHAAHHQNLCWQLIHALNLETKHIRNNWQHPSAYCGMHFSPSLFFLMLSSNSLLMDLSSSIPNVRCILALRLPSSVGDDSTYTYSCQVCEGAGNGGSPRCPLRHTDSHHHCHHHHHRVSSARGLRSNFQTCLNDHRIWNVSILLWATACVKQKKKKKTVWRTSAKGKRHRC